MMQAIPDRIKELLIGHMNDDLSAEQSAELMDWASQSPERHKFLERIKYDREFIDKLKWNYEAQENAWQTLSHAIDEQQPQTQPDVIPVIPLHPGRRKWWPAAAVAAAVVSVTAMVWLSKPQKQQVTATTTTTQLPNDVEAPVGNKAVLMIQGGESIVLDNVKNGLVVNNEAVNVTKEGDQLSYRSANGSVVTAVNTLKTLKGGYYRLVLPDGTKVWLNSESSLTYNTVFTGKKREVTLTGEAYFEVAHNASKPFYVTANGVQVKVLGTRFNINAYADDKIIRTTLLEGKVQLSNSSASVITLKPGQQAITDKTGIKLDVEPDIEKVIAWKNGIFYMKATDIFTIMKEVERWYDVTVVYKGNLESLKFNGKIPKSKPLSSLLEILEYTNKVHFTIQGKTVTVSPVE